MELQKIQNKIYEIRGRRVMLDFDLAALYGVETKALKQSVRRNMPRFEDDDFMFELSENEYNLLIDSLRSQFVTSNSSHGIGASGGRGGRRYMPFAFTETGVAMLSSVLRSETAILINRSIMRAFVMMRQYLSSAATDKSELAEIRAKLELLERNDEVLALNDELIARDGEETLRSLNDLSEEMRKDIDNLYTAIGELSLKPVQAPKPRRRIGYRLSTDDD